MTNKKIASTMSLILFASSAFSQESIQVKIDQATTVQTMNKDLLVTEAVLPAGTVIEVPIEAYQKAAPLPYWNQTATSSMPFVKGIKVIQAPGISATDLSNLNEWQSSEGLFMSKKLLGDAEVVETPISAKITIHQPTPILRNDGLNPTTGPAIAPAPKAELTPGEVKSLVNQIQETNLIVKQTGRTQSTCPACDNNHYAAWIKAGVPARPLQLALEELQKNPKGAIKNKHYLAIADFTRPSNEKRMYILNLDTGEVDKLYTSHSHRSDGNNAMAARFGNASRSNLTPPGFHVTQMGIHDGIHGASLILQGLEARNSNSADRAIEIHKADYASEAWVKANHYTGRSNGCLAIDPARIKDVIKKLRDGALVYNYIGE